ncbi:hypothetical protein FEM48_Zijuj05G0189900 [Ziziphus jujuba var. spinosa]|uniref:F-box domain-containing protein n=1 Tax=Ziziphus jujuba var. spinosa TaxID=714518 RepID=A0A978VGK5_ZIZJJ|nr:hypothetical protein FEM48_Zijuj05G0189900 [Ziziphus jujuba var. spinosa]
MAENAKKVHMSYEVAEEVSSLNSDVYFDVLSRLPTKNLLGLKCVSRGWHCLISGRPFIQTQLLRTESGVLGFISQGKFQWFDGDIETMYYIPVETAGAAVRQIAFDFLVENVVVLASCNGLICCRSCLPSQCPSIYICNPLIKDWIRVEWMAPNTESSIGLAFDPSQNPIDTSTNFKVVQAQLCETDEEEVRCISFEIYSSQTRAWRKSNEICHCNDSMFQGRSQGIFIRGILHWLTDGDHIVTFNVDNELSWLVSIPVPDLVFKTTPQACIGESKGQLHYVMLSEEGLQVWCLEEYFESKWALDHSKSLKMIEAENTQFFCNLRELVIQKNCSDHPWMCPLAFKDGILLMRVGAKIFLYNLLTSNFKGVCSVTQLGPACMFWPTVLPYSMSLIPLT